MKVLLFLIADLLSNTPLSTSFHKSLSVLRFVFHITISIFNIMFQYILLNSDATTDIPNIIPNNVNSYNFGDYNFPLTTDLAQWGRIISRKGNELTLENDSYDDVFIVVNTSSDKQTYNFVIDEKVIISITDYLSTSHNSFTRVINKQTFIINNG